MPLSENAPPVMRAAANVSHAIRRGESPERIDDLRRELKVAQLTKHIADIVDAWPPLTDEQRDRIAALLRPTSEKRDNAA